MKVPSSSGSAWQPTQLDFNTVRPAATSPGRPDEEVEDDDDVEEDDDDVEDDEEVEEDDDEDEEDVEEDDVLELEEDDELSSSLPPQPTSSPTTMKAKSFFTLYVPG